MAKKQKTYYELAIENGSEDVKYSLLADDENYLVQETVGDYAVLKFEAPDITDKERSIILHSKGYYLILREQEGKFHKKELLRFKKEGRFPEFSKELYREFLNRGSR